jgi:3-dehydroquinate dehydratase-2
MSKKKKILVVHGPNLDLLGKREPAVYGRSTLKEINSSLKALAKKSGVALSIQQSNHEGEIVDLVGRCAGKGFCAVLINPVAYTHTSVALRDAVAGCGVPVVEVHLSNIYSREEFRHKSLVSPVAKGTVMGFGPASYTLGLQALLDIIS